jgi:hypothetical protein
VSEPSTRGPSPPGLLLGVALLAALLLSPSFAVARPPRTTPTEGVRAAAAPANLTVSDPQLTIQLPVLPRVGTNNATLDAVWGAVPSGCGLQSEWTAWFLPVSTAAAGYFASPDAAQTLFVPVGWNSETSEVGVRSAADLYCGAQSRTVEAAAFSNVTTFPTLRLTNLSVDPSATAVPGRVQLTGWVEGGQAPYVLGVDWGDRTSTDQMLNVSGSFVVLHTYGEGTFQPRVGLTDSNRVNGEGVVPEPVEVGNGTVLAIKSSLPVAEVGIPVSFQGSVQRPMARYESGIACGANPILLPAQVITSVTCTPTDAGALGVTFAVGTPALTIVSQVTREQPVAGALALHVRPIAPSLDAGTPTYVLVTIVGGVPPFQVRCGSLNGSLSSRAGAPADGAFLVPWTPPSAGAAGLTGSVTDSLGATATAPGVKLVVAAPPYLIEQANATIGFVATAVTFQATALGGSPPLLWGLESNFPPATESPAAGGTVNGSFAWSGSFLAEGVATLTWEVEDAAGAVLTGATSVALPARPTVEVWPMPYDSSGSSGPALLVTVDGGVLPFSLWVNSSGSGVWNGSESSSGPYAVPLSSDAPGLANLSIVLVDARGVRVSVYASLTVPELGSVPVRGPGPNLTPWVVGVALTGAVGGIALARWRRRPPPPESPPPDPEALLEGLLRPADGADRLTIELMAEEEGVSLETVRSTLDRLIREGRVRSESDPDGGEVLAWEDA